jgi:hypothetical protein
VRVIIVTEQELKSLGEAINRDYLEYCLKAGVKHDLMDHPVGHNPAEGIYKKVHFTLHRWLNEVGSTTRVEHMDSDIMKQRTRDLRWMDMGLITERWVNEDTDSVHADKAMDITASQFNDPDDEALFRAGYLAARNDLRKELEKYLANKPKY